MVFTVFYESDLEMLYICHFSKGKIQITQVNGKINLKVQHKRVQHFLSQININ